MARARYPRPPLDDGHETGVVVLVKKTTLTATLVNYSVSSSLVVSIREVWTYAAVAAKASTLLALVIVASAKANIAAKITRAPNLTPFLPSSIWNRTTVESKGKRLATAVVADWFARDLCLQIEDANPPRCWRTITGEPAVFDKQVEITWKDTNNTVRKVRCYVVLNAPEDHLYMPLFGNEFAREFGDGLLPLNEEDLIAYTAQASPKDIELIRIQEEERRVEEEEREERERRRQYEERKKREKREREERRRNAGRDGRSGR